MLASSVFLQVSDGHKGLAAPITGRPLRAEVDPEVGGEGRLDREGSRAVRTSVGLLLKRWIFCFQKRSANEVYLERGQYFVLTQSNIRVFLSPEIEERGRL